MSQVTILESKQASLFSLVQNLYDLSQKARTNSTAASFFKIRLLTIDKTREEYIQLIEQLNKAKLEEKPDEFVPEFKALETFDELYCHIKATESILAADDLKPNVVHKPTHKLPVLELVSFNGDPSHWPLFYQNFKEMINDNVSLTDAERIQYLISKLSGSALCVTAGILPVASNYKVIWNLLVEKYQDPRLLASQYFDKVLKFKQITTPSAQNLELFLEHFCASVTALKLSDISDLSDYMLLHIALNKLDKETVTLFEQRHGKEKIPTFESLQQFVKQQRKVACHVQLHNSMPASTASPSRVAIKQQKPTYALVTNPDDWVKGCVVCKSEDSHPLYRCQRFTTLRPEERFDIVAKNAFCTNCLGFHSFRNCRSNNVCAKCNKRHHSLIHLNYDTLASKFNLNKRFNQNKPNVQQQPAGSVNALHMNASEFPNEIDYDFDVSDTCIYDSIYESANEEKGSPITSQPAVTLCADHRTASFDVSLTSNKNISTEISPTARVLVKNKTNIQQEMRILLDTGSNLNFVTTDLCEKLGLKIERFSSKVHGIGNSAQDIIGRVTLTFCSQYDPRYTYTVQAAVLNKLTGELPHTKLTMNHIPLILKELQLADQYFDTPGEIDCIIGSGLFPHLLLSNKVNIPQTNLVAIQSTLGYILMGQFNCQDSNQDNTKLFTHVAISNRKLESLTQKFWELESIQSRKIMSPEEKKCEEIFVQSCTRDTTGRYTVSLPLCEDPDVLGDSYQIAKKRLNHLERKLDSNLDLRTGYNNTIQEYVDQGYLLKLTDPKDIQTSSPAYYTPHRAVYKPEKKTSKTRIVLDASCATTSGKSLNDILYTGPNLQSNIFDLLVNVRLFSVAISADLEKMYFQLKVNPEHQPLQRILYRFDTQSPVDIYQFERVSFGLKCSPYLALRVVRQLAKDESQSFPNLVDVVSTYSYMDDFLTSLPNEDDALELFSQLTELFKRGGFKLTKWISNSQNFLEKIPEVSRVTKNLSFDADTDSETKIIGMHWNPVDDTFFFNAKPATSNSEHTKRSVLSTTASLFDPLGILAPSVALMKLIIQECWRRSLDWDDPLPSDLNNLWEKILQELPCLIKLKIPRYVGLFQGSLVSLIGFSDASERCYGAAIYVRIGSLKDMSSSVSLLCAKSRLASGRQTLARLELCAAHLLAKLMNVVYNIVAHRAQIENILAYSDSTITLAWINSSPHRWQTFVANRVAEIQELLPPPHWFHIPGEHNISDLITRPVTPINLIENSNWFHGPDWMGQPQACWPVNYKENLPQHIPEAKMVSFVQSIEPNPLTTLAERVSKWSILLNVTVYILRFMRKLKSRGKISLSDLATAENFIIIHLQSKHFSSDIEALKSNKRCSSSLQKFNPFLVDDILRVGGRLNNASISYNQQHPILLPSKDNIVKMLVEYLHRLHLHAGPGLLLALIRHNYWILSARTLVRKIVHSCNKCFRLKPKEAQYLMGDLPDFRVHQIKPFAKCGVDYAGPLNITLSKHRGVRSQKAYICLFVCLATKGVHIELVSDLSSEKFLSAFKRFISRRGPCSLIMSDGGRNFVGAKRQLNDLHNLVTSPDYYNVIIKELMPKKIEFRMNSPYSPHMGGLWESNIKSMKNILYKVIGTQILTYEELNTVLIEVECLLNSRPLCVLSNDPSDPMALTPAHFLNSTPLKFLPAENVIETPCNRLQRYALLDKIVQSYWKRWHNEYLSTLQSREKWNVKNHPITVGTVVVLKEDNLPPLMWPLGVIIEVFPGKDEVIRVVKVKTKTGSYVRPVVKVCPLPSQ